MSQLFGMDFSSLVNRAEQTNRKNDKVENAKNTIGKPEISKETSNYYEQLKAKYKDVEFVLVEDEQMANAKQLAGDVETDKGLIVMVSESELEAMATDEATRTKNEQMIADALNQMPQMKAELEDAGVEVKSFGMEFHEDGSVSYFAVLDKFSEAQKERIENQKAEKAENAKEAQKSRKNERVITASGIEELIKKIKDAAYEDKTNSVMTEQEKMIGQHFDIKF